MTPLTNIYTNYPPPVDVGYFPPAPPTGGGIPTGKILLFFFILALILAVLAHRMGW
jgi:hypothetical protein